MGVRSLLDVFDKRVEERDKRKLNNSQARQFSGVGISPKRENMSLSVTLTHHVTEICHILGEAGWMHELIKKNNNESVIITCRQE